MARDEPGKESSIIEFVPEGEGTLRSQPEPPALPPAQLARAMTLARVAAHQLDTNADGRVDGKDTVGKIAHDVVKSFTEATRQSLNISNQTRAPWLREHGVMIDNETFFDRATMIDLLHGDPKLKGLRRHDIDAAITQALPGGVTPITLADTCRAEPKLPCLPLGKRVLVHLEGPTI